MVLRNKNGFTLVEILVSLAVLVVFFLLAMPNFKSYGEEDKIFSASMLLMMDLRHLQNRAVNGEVVAVSGSDVVPDIYQLVTNNQGYTLQYLVGDTPYIIKEENWPQYSANSVGCKINFPVYQSLPLVEDCNLINIEGTDMVFIFIINSLDDVKGAIVNLVSGKITYDERMIEEVYELYYN